MKLEGCKWGCVWGNGEEEEKNHKKLCMKRAERNYFFYINLKHKTKEKTCTFSFWILSLWISVLWYHITGIIEFMLLCLVSFIRIACFRFIRMPAVCYCLWMHCLWPIAQICHRLFTPWPGISALSTFWTLWPLRLWTYLHMLLFEHLLLALSEYLYYFNWTLPLFLFLIFFFSSFFLTGSTMDWWGTGL